MATVVTRRAPVAPSGCPMAREPPLTFTFSIGIPSSRMDGITWAAKASLNSTRSIRSAPIPAWARAFRVETIGPMPISWGFTPPTPSPTIRARGSILSRVAISSLITSAAETPSLVGQEFPAVITISLSPRLITPLMGGSCASFSSVVPARIPSSRSKLTVGPVSPSTQLPWSSNTGSSTSRGSTSSL